MTCGIYMIQNLVNGKMYIGQSVDIEKRWGEHRSGLRGNDHGNKHLQRSWNKYGEDNFEFTIICECAESQLNTMEEYYIFELMSYDERVGYNKTYGGEGCRPTEETRQKLSEAHTGKTLSEEHKKKISETLKGKPRPEETKSRISETLKGRTLSEEHKNKLSESLKGRTSPNKGRTFSEEHKNKLSESLKGRTLSEETRRKLSIPIVQIDPSTNKVVNVWSSSIDAERTGGFNHGAIIQCCKNKYNREGNNIYKGYKWQYLHEVD